MIGLKVANIHSIFNLSICLLLMVAQRQATGQGSLFCYRQYGVGYCYREGPDYPRDKVAKNIANFRDVTKKMYGPETSYTDFKVVKNLEEEVAIEVPSDLFKNAEASTSEISNKYRPSSLLSHTAESLKTLSPPIPRIERKAQPSPNQELFLGYLPPKYGRRQEGPEGQVTASRLRSLRARSGLSFRSRSRNYSLPFTPASMPHRIRANSRTVKRWNTRESRTHPNTGQSQRRVKRDLPLENVEEDDDLENCCPSERKFHMPPWMQNTRGQWRIIVNEEPFVPRIQTVRCLYNTTRHCNNGCRCVQQMTMHTLLAFDEDRECSGIFNDHFLIPSECVCRCPKSRE